MSGFPLYDNLIKDLPKKDLTPKQKTDFITNISNIDLTGQELIYALVQFYYLCENSELSTNLPYKGIKEQKDNELYNITWNLSDFPIKLRALLYKFMNMHLKTLQEEDTRNEQILKD
jgi:hypothetical protein